MKQLYVMMAQKGFAPNVRRLLPEVSVCVAGGSMHFHGLHVGNSILASLCGCCDPGLVSHVGIGGLGAVHVPGALDGSRAAILCNALQCVIYTCEVAAGCMGGITKSDVLENNLHTEQDGFPAPCVSCCPLHCSPLSLTRAVSPWMPVTHGTAHLLSSTPQLP